MSSPVPIGIGAAFAGAGVGARAFGPVTFGLVFSGLPLLMAWLTHGRSIVRA